MMPEDAYISHKTSTRLRVRVPSRRRDTAWFARVKERLSSLSGVDAVNVNDLSGSILIVHRLAGIKSILAAAKKQGLFQIARPNARNPVTLRKGIAEGIRTVNRRVTAVTGGQVDLWDVAFLGLAGFGVYQLLRGNIAAPMWYTVAWYAFNVYMKANAGDVASE